MLSIVALIPARSGSKRLPRKNVLELEGHPLLGRTISTAKQSGIFADVIVSTDEREYADIALAYGATVPFLRPKEFATDASPDIEWISHLFQNIKKTYDCFSILRPTHPFRTAETIKRAWKTFQAIPLLDSLRAIEPCHEHPAKQWTVEGAFLEPIMKRENGNPWHSTPYQELPKVFAQNASLEIAWSSVVTEQSTISGERIAPFFTEGYEGFDIHTKEDLILAEELVRRGLVTLPTVEVLAHS